MLFRGKIGRRDVGLSQQHSQDATIDGKPRKITKRQAIFTQMVNESAS